MTTHGVALAAGFLARALRAQWQVWEPILGMISGKAGDLKSRAALHKPVASRKMHKPPSIAARMSNGTPRKPCICVSSRLSTEHPANFWQSYNVTFRGTTPQLSYESKDAALSRI